MKAVTSEPGQGMDLVLIIRDARADSFISNLLLAIEAKKDGWRVVVLFSGEALTTLEDGILIWARRLTPSDVRLKMADAAKSLGIPVSGVGVSKILDANKMIERAREAGVPMHACYPWTDLLGSSLPAGITRADTASVLSIIRDAKTVVGSL